MMTKKKIRVKIHSETSSKTKLMTTTQLHAFIKDFNNDKRIVSIRLTKQKRISSIRLKK